MLLKTQVFYAVHQHSDGTTVPQNVASYLPNDTSTALQSFRMLPATHRMTLLTSHKTWNFRYVLYVLWKQEVPFMLLQFIIMKCQFMYSPSQIKVHLVSCTHTVVFKWANYNKCAATWHMVPFLLCTQHPTDLQKIIYKLIINNESLYCLSNNEMLKKVMFSVTNGGKPLVLWIYKLLQTYDLT